MSKIIVLITPAEGHFNPFVPIIRKLIERKHEVVCIAGRAFKKRVEDTGANFTPIPEKWDPHEMEIYDFFPELKRKKSISQIKYYIKHVLIDMIPDMLIELQNVLKEFPADLVIYDSFQAAGFYMSELGGPPGVLLSVLPLNMPGKDIAPFGLGWLPGKTVISKLRNNLLNTIFMQFVYKDIQDHVNKMQKEIGLPALQKHIFIDAFERSNLVLHTSIPSFEYKRAEFPPNFHFIGPISAPADHNFRKPEWWQQADKDLPVVLINQGTIAKDLDNLIRPAIDALKNEEVVVLAVPVKKGEIPNLPENTHTEPFIPFGNILPFVDIMVTNGGFGGTQNALAHGIPVVIAGATEDKMEVAARLENTGAGINLRMQKSKPELIKKAVKKILSDPSYKKQAEKLRAEYAKYDAPTLAVELCEKLIQENR
jgi:MGT family glycosyltransferase